MPQKTKVLYIISDIDRAIPFEWLWDAFVGRDMSDLMFCFLGNHIPESMRLLSSKAAPTIFFRCSNKLFWPEVLIKLILLINREKPDVIHSHLITANILGLLAGSILRVPKRIYTRHHSTIHHDSFKKGVLWDHLCNLLATQIISVSQATTYALNVLERVPMSKLLEINHGIPVQDLAAQVSFSDGKLRAKYHIDANAFVVGVISRPVSWKGITCIIDSFSSLLQSEPSVMYHFVFLGGYFHSPESTFVKHIHNALHPNSYTLINFEEDIPSVYAGIDLLVHCPINSKVEAFGQVYLESIAAGVPLVCTLSGIASEILIDKHNARVVNYNDSKAICAAVHELATDQAFARRIATNAKDELARFDISHMIKKLETLYSAISIA